MHGIDRIRKAAILLLSLPEQQAIDLLARLEPRQARRVLAEIAKNQAISESERQRVVLEFAGVDPASLFQTHPGKPVAERLLTELRRAPRTAIVQLRRLTTARPLEFLRAVEPARLQRLLADEHPQTIALVASRMPRAKAAALLALLSDGEREQIARRMAVLLPVSTSVLGDVAHALRWRLLADSKSHLRPDPAPASTGLLAGPHFVSPVPATS